MMMYRGQQDSSMHIWANQGLKLSILIMNPKLDIDLNMIVIYSSTIKGSIAIKIGD